MYRLDLSGSNSTAFTERIIGLYLFWLLVFGELLYVLLLLMILSFRSYGQLDEEMLSFHQGFRQFFFFFFPIAYHKVALQFTVASQLTLYNCIKIGEIV